MYSPKPKEAHSVDMAFDAANAYHSQYTNVTGLATGTKTRKSENQNWLTSATYYTTEGV